MSTQHPMVESTFAAARAHLEDARSHEHYALTYASEQYAPGAVGRTAKRLYRSHDERRARCIAMALICRAKAKRLRAEFARIAAEDTIPPRAA